MIDFKTYSNTLFFGEGESAEKIIHQFEIDLLTGFAKSNEGKSVIRKDISVENTWSALFLQIIHNKIRYPINFLTVQDIRDICYHIIPHSVVIPPSDAKEIIKELKAFFMFLKREYNLENADKYLRVFNQKNIVARMEKELADPSNYNLSKRVLMEAVESGVDINDEKALKAFIDVYNQKLMEQVPSSQETISEEIKEKRDEIIAILKPICEKHLNTEYAEISQRMIETLAEIPLTPISKGRSNSWAAAVVYAVGRVNFLFDPSQTPHLKATDLCKLFNVSQNTASAKAKQIMDDLDITLMNPEWTVNSLTDNNPMIWMVMVNGMFVDIRHMPREIQEQAYRQGIIPYIPADKD